MDELGQVSLDAVSAGLRRDGADLSLYGGFLIATLTESLPPELVRVERHRSAGDRMHGRPGEITEVEVELGDFRYTLRRKAVGARPEATIAHCSGGITMSTDAVALDDWARRLAEGLVSRAGADAAAADAAARLAVPRGSDL